MHIIEWESHLIGESFELNQQASFWDGRIYKLSYNNKSGSVVTKPAFKMTTSSINGYGYFDATEIYLQLTSQKDKNTLNICKRENDGGAIGQIEEHRFWLHGVAYYVDVKKRKIFNDKSPGDFTVDVRLPFMKELISLKVYILNKKWYKPLSYLDHIYGTITLDGEPNWEFILALFLQLDYYFDSHTNYND